MRPGGVDRVALHSKGVKLIFINDRDSNFLPIVSFNSSPCTFERSLRPNLNAFSARLNLSVNYFNVNIGRWEPFLEPFTVSMSDRHDYENH